MQIIVSCSYYTVFYITENTDVNNIKSQNNFCCQLSTPFLNYVNIPSIMSPIICELSLWCLDCMYDVRFESGRSGSSLHSCQTTVC